MSKNFQTTPQSDVARQFEQVLAKISTVPKEDLDGLRASVAAFLEHASYDEIDIAEQRVAELLSSRSGRIAQDTEVEKFAHLAGTLRQLSAAGVEATDAAVSRLLRSYQQKPVRILRYLCNLPAGTDAVAQATCSADLAIEPTYLSKVLGEMERLDLIVRWQEGKAKYLVAAKRGLQQLVHFDAEEHPLLTDIPYIATTHTDAAKRAEAVLPAGRRRPALAWAYGRPTAA